MVNKGRSYFFLDKETWSQIISTHDCFTFKSFNSKEKIQSHSKNNLFFPLFFHLSQDSMNLLTKNGKQLILIYNNENFFQDMELMNVMCYAK